MPKPLFRFTVGNCLQQGLDILAESIDRTTRSLGLDKWDWAVCYNGLNSEELGFLRDHIGDRPIKLISQNWATCPVDDHCQTPRREDGSFEYDGKQCGGTMWKVCPPRLRMETHEIVMDNDVILLKKFPQIDEFLKRNDHALLLEENIRFYGRYDALFPHDPPYLNSGFMGFPPGYDFGAAILEQWTKYKSFQHLTQADEQGLLTYTLSLFPAMRVRANQMIEVLHRDFKTKLTGDEEGIHFVQSNRIPNHHAWGKYQEMMAKKRVM